VSNAANSYIVRPAERETVFGYRQRLHKTVIGGVHTAAAQHCSAQPSNLGHPQARAANQAPPAPGRYSPEEFHVTLLTWNHACPIGVRAMDDQHGILMDAVNELRLAVVRGSGREQVSQLLEQLIEFTNMHFASEEQLMRRAGFPGLAAHCAAHSEILEQIRHTAQRVQHGEGLKMRPLLLNLRDWYIAHIEEMDREYGPWLNERGVS
jgi:hemerythrin-like metal-binding protein